VTPRFSFIVPVRNDAARLARCLRSIRANRGAVNIEIVVVDNGSTDGSTQVARRFGASVRVIPNGRVSGLRNQGARHAAGDVLAFVDADHEIGAGWVAAAFETLQADAVGAVGALCHSPADGTWVQQAYGRLRGRPRGQHDVEWLGSGNLAVWRRTFDAVDGFDTSLETCEDVDLCQRIRASGLRIVSDARLDNVHHGDPKTLQDLFRSELWRGRDNMRVSFRGPIAWTSLPSAVLPMIDLMLLGIAPLGLVAMAAGWKPGLALSAAALAMFLGASAIKTIRALLRERRIGWADIWQTLAVVCVYDLARALALVARAPHRSVRSSPAAATS
jgi:GT2 family glycosyltransferase